MKLDLFTFFAQIINFIVLVLLLYHFLFKKIIRAIDQREETISDEFKEAEKKKEEARLAAQEHKKQLKEFHLQKIELLKKAKDQVNEEKTRDLELARVSIAEKQREWEKKLENEKEEFLKKLQEKIAKTTYTIADSVVTDLASVDFQSLIYKRFLEFLNQLSQERLQNFRQVYSEAKEKKITILSSFELSNEEKDQIEALIKELLKNEAVIVYKIEANHFLGISLKIGGFQLNWTSSNYFAKLEDEFEKILSEKDG